jgi:hypothetical protein
VALHHVSFDQLYLGWLIFWTYMLGPIAMFKARNDFWSTMRRALFDLFDGVNWRALVVLWLLVMLSTLVLALADASLGLAVAVWGLFAVMMAACLWVPAVDRARRREPHA